MNANNKSIVVDLAAHSLEKQAEDFVASINVTDCMSNYRKTSLKNFKRLGFPTIRHEDWKYTDLQGLIQQKFILNKESKSSLKEEQQTYLTNYIAEIKAANTLVNVLVVIDGNYNTELSLVGNNKDLDDYIGGLKDFIGLAKNSKQEGVIEKLFLDNNEHALYNFIGATWNDGIVINLKDNKMNHHVTVLYVNSGKYNHTIFNNKNICCVGSNVFLELTEEYLNISPVDTKDAVNLNVAFDIRLHSNSVCKHYILQDHKETDYHLSVYSTIQYKNSEYHNFNLNLGGHLSRQDILINQKEDHASSYLYGLFLPRTTQHMDTHLKVYHNASHGHSVQDYRGILAGRGHGVFNGMVFVAKDTVKNNAEQSNKNILLSPHAQIDTKPELQIYADDVVCKHGATIGKLDNQSMFYLQSRGIDKVEAKKLLILAFINHFNTYINNNRVLDWLNIRLSKILEYI